MIDLIDAPKAMAGEALSHGFFVFSAGGIRR
jgi:hypothetical protein